MLFRGGRDPSNCVGAWPSASRPANEDPDDPGTYIVRGEYAHVWPEVFISGAGWVAYEPTPPSTAEPRNAQSYTGVDAAGAGRRSRSGRGPRPPPRPPWAFRQTPRARPASFPDSEIGLLSGDENRGDGGSSSESAPTRYVYRPILRAIPVVLGLLVAYVALFPLGLAVREASATEPGDDAPRAGPAGVDRVGRERRHRRLRGAGQRHLRGACPPARTGLAEAADPALTLAARLEVGSYSEAGAQAEDATVAWEAAGAIGEAARSRPPSRSGCSAGSTRSGCCDRGDGIGRPASAASR